MWGAYGRGGSCVVRERRFLAGHTKTVTVCNLQHDVTITTAYAYHSKMKMPKYWVLVGSQLRSPDSTK